VSFCGDKITYQGVIDNLNVLDYVYYFKIVDAFLAGNVSESLLIFNEVLNKGFDASHFITGLSSHLRDVLVSKDTSTLKLLEVGDDIAKRYATQAQACPTEFIFQALKISNDCDLNYRLSKNKRLLVEIALIRMCQLNDQKKKSILTDEQPVALKKIIVETDKEDVKSDVKSKVVTKTKSQYTQSQEAQVVSEPTKEISTPKLNKVEKRKAPTNLKRPISISINKSTVQSSDKTDAASTADSVQETFNESFDYEKLINAWRAFAATINDDSRRIGFENTNLPEIISDTQFEVLVNNVMQETEFKKTQSELVQFLRNFLRNSSIQITIRVKEESEIQRSTSPEEKFQIFSELNPALERLRKNLHLEID
jgi:DNA polymerase-3 subunit gamma/tau